MTKVCYWNHLGGEAPIWIVKITVQFVHLKTEGQGKRESYGYRKVRVIVLVLELGERSKWSICNFSIEILEIYNEEYLV